MVNSWVVLKSYLEADDTRTVDPQAWMGAVKGNYEEIVLTYGKAINKITPVMRQISLIKYPHRLLPLNFPFNHPQYTHMTSLANHGLCFATVVPVPNPFYRV